MNCLAFGKNSVNFLPFKFWHLKLSASYLKKSVCGRDLKLGQLIGDDE